MRYDIMKAAFRDELQKIAVSEKWIASKIHSGLSKLGPKESLQRARKFSNSMQRLSDKAMTRVDGTLDSKKFDKALGHSERAERAAGHAWKADSSLHKNAGALQGHVRSGRRPLKADTLLKREKESSKDDKKKIADLTKLSNKADVVAKLIPDAKTLGLLGIGAYGMHRLQKMNRRYQMGRQVEMQQQQGW